MDAKERALAGALGGAAGTLVLSGLRKALSRTGLVFETAPMQVVDRVEELGLFGDEDLSPGFRRFLTAAAHIAYGVGIETALGLVRRERGELVEEAAVGSALGVLAWGAGWSSWLPLTGVHSPPWRQHSPKVLLPLLDHALYGVAWGLAYWTLTRKQR
jgi:hypothetical protein